VKSLDRLHHDLPGYNTKTCLETTVGAGTNLGYDFLHLGFIRSEVKEPDRIAFCLDTCHITGAGYDMTSSEKADDVLERFDAEAGLSPIKVFHFNDSVGAVGSRIDRHAHIGKGCCGLSCFRSILTHPLFASIPKIIETSKENNDRGKPMDQVNIAKLRRMARKSNNRR